MEVSTAFKHAEIPFICEVNRLSLENKGLFLAKKFYKFQLEDCKREKEVLISEVDLLDRLLKERQMKMEEEQSRLISRYKSQFEILRAECETHCAKTRSFEGEINEMVKREGDFIRQLADLQLAYNENKALLETVKKENQTLQMKLSSNEEMMLAAIQLKHENSTLKQAHQRFKDKAESQQQEIFRLSAEVQRLTDGWNAEKKEIVNSLKEEKKKYEDQLEGLNFNIITKQVLVEKKDLKVQELQNLLEVERKKTKFLYEKIQTVDGLVEDHKKLNEKYHRTKGSKDEVSKKYKESKCDNVSLSKKIEGLKQQLSESSTESEEEIRLLKKESSGMKLKLEKKKKSFADEMETMSKQKKKLERKVAELERAIKQQHSSSEDENSNHVRRLKKEKEEWKAKEGQSAKQVKKLKREIEEQEKKSSEESEALKKEIQELREELENEKKNKKELNKVKESSVDLDDSVEEMDEIDLDYDDDFEDPPSEPFQEESVAEISVSKKSNSSIEDFKYSEESFESTASEAKDYQLGSKEKLSKQEGDYESNFNEESVAEIESDSEFEKSGLFFGASNVKLDIDTAQKISEADIEPDTESEKSGLFFGGNNVQLEINALEESEAEIEPDSESDKSGLFFGKNKAQSRNIESEVRKENNMPSEVKSKAAEVIYAKSPKENVIVGTGSLKNIEFIEVEASKENKITSKIQSKNIEAIDIEVPKKNKVAKLAKKPKNTVKSKPKTASLTSNRSATSLGALTNESTLRSRKSLSSLSGAPSVQSVTEPLKASMTSLAQAPSLTSSDIESGKTPSKGKKASSKTKKSSSKVTADDIFGSKPSKKPSKKGGKEKKANASKSEKITAADIFGKSSKGRIKIDNGKLGGNINDILGRL